MKRVAIIGCGDLGIQIAHHASETQELDIVGFFDDFTMVGTSISGVPVLGNINDILKLYSSGIFDELLIGVGYKHVTFRNQLFEQFKAKIPFARLIHPHAWVDPTSTIGPGAVVYPGCVIDMHSTIGANTLLNIGCVIAHHTNIGMGCFLSPAVKLAGFVQIESSSVLGIGTIVIDNISIISGVRTGAGAVVINDIRVPGLYVGVPAKLKKKELK